MAEDKKDKAKKEGGNIVCGHRWATILLAYGVSKEKLAPCIRDLESSTA